MVGGVGNTVKISVNAERIDYRKRDQGVINTVSDRPGRSYSIQLRRVD